MSRLTDDFMADLEQKLAAIENDYRPECISCNYGSGCAGATDASIAFWRAAVDCVPAMLAELRERRAADLSDEEREALEHAAGHLRSRGGVLKAFAAKTINRLLSRSKGEANE